MTTKPPSIAQMLNRANAGHVKVLRLYAEDRTYEPVSDSDWRGLSTCRSTLRGWGCIDRADEITDRGRELLAAYDAKNAA